MRVADQIGVYLMSLPDNRKTLARLFKFIRPDLFGYWQDDPFKPVDLLDHDAILKIMEEIEENGYDLTHRWSV